MAPFETPPFKLSSNGIGIGPLGSLDFKTLKISVSKSCDQEGEWEVDVFVSFFRVLYLVRVRQKGEDKLWWVPSKKSLFVFRSFYSVLARNDGFHFLWKSVWRTKVPLRAAHFAWLAALGKILTIDNLRKRHVIVVDRCCMRKMNKGESVDHILFHCEVVGALCYVFFS